MQGPGDVPGMLGETMTTNEYVNAYIHKQLDSIKAHPGMWGDKLSIELQFLLLLDFWYVTNQPGAHAVNPRWVHDEYEKFRRKSSYQANLTIACQVATVEDVVDFMWLFEMDFFGPKTNAPT